MKHHWICQACATEMGGVLPDACITMRSGTCQYCDGSKQAGGLLIPWVDFDWPKDRVKNWEARMARD